MIKILPQFSFKYVFWVASFIFVTGCATYNAATGRHEFIMIPTSDEISMGKSLHEGIKKDKKLIENGPQIERLRDIGERLALVSDRQDIAHNFYLIEDNELNAFTTPGGNVYFNTGLLNKLDSDDEVAFVLGHEIAHGAARHTIKKLQAALGANIISAVVLSQLEGKNTQQTAAISSVVLMNVVFSAYSRKDEYESDRLGVKYMYLAGFDPQGAVGALQALEEEAKKGPQMPVLFRSHPYTKDRVEAMKVEVLNVQAKYGNPS